MFLFEQVLSHLASQIPVLIERGHLRGCTDDFAVGPQEKGRRKLMHGASVCGIPFPLVFQR